MSVRPKLKEYQKEGALWLSRKRIALLGDEMGIGKTAQAVHAIDLIDSKNTLIICPASVVDNWWREIDKFKDLNRKTGITKIMSYDRARIDLPAHKIMKDVLKWDTLILDEAHKLKNPSAGRSQAVFGLGGYAHMTRRVWALSGTPAPNHAAELWILFRISRITDLPYDKFVDEFCDAHMNTFNEFQIRGTKKEKIPEVRRMLSQLMLRRLKRDVLPELPPIFFQDLVVSAPPVAQMPRDMLNQLAAELEYATRRLDLEITLDNEDNLLLILEGLAQSVSTLVRYTGIQKATAVLPVLQDELENEAYDKILLFAIHTDVVEMLRDGLKDFNPVILTGSVPKEKRQAVVDRFQNDPATRVFIGNIKAAGEGITLTAASNVMMVEQSWVPAENSQAVMRAHRIGQEEPVFVRFVSLANSIDEKINRILRRKTGELAQIFDA